MWSLCRAHNTRVSSIFHLIANNMRIWNKMHVHAHAARYMAFVFDLRDPERSVNSSELSIYIDWNFGCDDHKSVIQLRTTFAVRKTVTKNGADYHVVAEAILQHRKLISDSNCECVDCGMFKSVAFVHYLRDGDARDACTFIITRSTTRSECRLQYDNNNEWIGRHGMHKR